MNFLTMGGTPLSFIFQDDATFTTSFVPRITMLAYSCCYFEVPTGWPTTVVTPTSCLTSTRVFFSYYLLLVSTSFYIFVEDGVFVCR